MGIYETKPGFHRHKITDVNQSLIDLTDSQRGCRSTFRNELLLTCSRTITSSSTRALAHTWSVSSKCWVIVSSACQARIASNWADFVRPATTQSVRSLRIAGRIRIKFRLTSSRQPRLGRVTNQRRASVVSCADLSAGLTYIPLGISSVFEENSVDLSDPLRSLSHTSVLENRYRRCVRKTKHFLEAHRHPTTTNRLFLGFLRFHPCSQSRAMVTSCGSTSIDHVTPTSIDRRHWSQPDERYWYDRRIAELTGRHYPLRICCSHNERRCLKA